MFRRCFLRRKPATSSAASAAKTAGGSGNGSGNGAGFVQVMRDTMKKSEAEVQEMTKTAGKGKGWFTRWIVKERSIDRLVHEVDGILKFELHSSFQWAIDLTSMLVVMGPVFLCCYDYVNPTRLLVAVGTITEATYTDVFQNRLHWTVVPIMQFTSFWLWYDASAWVRYLIFARVYGPLWKRMGWVRPPTPASSTSSLRRNATREGGQVTTIGVRPPPTTSIRGGFGNWVLKQLAAARSNASAVAGGPALTGAVPAGVTASPMRLKSASPYAPKTATTGKSGAAVGSRAGLKSNVSASTTSARAGKP